MTIARAAKTVGLSASALRYYEREGFLFPSGRTRSGYRLYDHASLERLRFLRAAQSIGLPLKDIRAVLDMDARTNRPQMRELLETRLAEVEAKLKELNTVRDALSRALARCRRSGECCNVLVSLSVGETGRTGVKHEQVHVQDSGRDGDRGGGADDRVRLNGRTRRRFDGGRQR
ncbi:MAG: MerR family transcriptional regulator [Phycisphaeraceae bacterium]|nr:MerR family transcriptional regulator [Phycisphaeraceae bacterium]